MGTVRECGAIGDFKSGLAGGGQAWLLVDLALSRGLRVSEMAALRIKDVDLKRGCISVNRLKRKKKIKEALAIGNRQGNSYNSKMLISSFRSLR